MKKLLIALLLAVSANIFTQVQYKYYEVPSGTTNDLKDIRSVNNGYNSYFICGNNGTLLNIQGADSICKVITSGTSTNLNGIYLNSSSSNFAEFFIFGNNGFYINTSNHGNNWSERYIGYPNNLYSGLFLIGTYANIYGFKYFAVGSNGLILKRKFYPSPDTNWYLIPSGTSNDLKSINTFNTFGTTNSSNPFAWIAGANGTILRTIDTGYTWSQMNSGTTKNLNYVFFITKDTGFIVGDGGTILKSTNGGLSWIQKISNTSQNLNNIFNLFSYSIYIAGDKVILNSTDKGENWIIDTLAPHYNFYSGFLLHSDYYQNSIPFFIGESGKIFKKSLDTTFHLNRYIKLDGNNISSYLTKYGVIDNNPNLTNTPGFEWPKGSGKHAMFTAGFCIGAFVNNQLRQASASYRGEYLPGYCDNGIYKKSDIFKYYKISRGDNSQNSWDWANWGLMVPYGAPFIDVNHNGIYEPAIDTPGVKNAVQTIFYCMTDADSNNHSAGEGFGGGTQPLGAEVHLTAWVYDTPDLQNVQFLNYVVINKSNSVWNRTYVGLFSDPDLGDANDDVTGCDTSLKLSFCYNEDNYDLIYGSNPPAVGFTLLSSPVNKNVVPIKNLGMSSITSPYKYFSVCEGEFGWYLKGAYLSLAGYKNDSTSYLDPTQTPFVKTKYTYSGDPETNVGWTRLKGCIANCNNDSTGTISAPAPAGDMKMIFSSGANDFSIAPGDTQKFVVAQMIARGTNNLNSVTELKNLCAQVRNYYDINFPFVINPVPPPVEIPQNYSLSQNYPNPFNSSTRIKFEIPLINGSANNSIHVTLKVYDLLGREVITLVNGNYLPNKYEISFEGKTIASGMYFYRLTAGDFTAVKRMVLVK